MHGNGTSSDQNRSLIEHWKSSVRRLKLETYTLYLAYKDPRVPWYAKLFTALIVGHTLSPIDLIPDFIPVLGYLDDLVIVPFGIMLALKMIPQAVLDECREKANCQLHQDKSAHKVAAAIIILIWILVCTILISLVICWIHQ